MNINAASKEDLAHHIQPFLEKEFAINKFLINLKTRLLRQENWMMLNIRDHFDKMGRYTFYEYVFDWDMDKSWDDLEWQGQGGYSLEDIRAELMRCAEFSYQAIWNYNMLNYGMPSLTAIKKREQSYR